MKTIMTQVTNEEVAKQVLQFLNQLLVLLETNDYVFADDLGITQDEYDASCGESQQRKGETMTTIAIITRNPDAVQQYFGFGCHEVDRGRTKFGDHAIIASCPNWKAEWGYES